MKRSLVLILIVVALSLSAAFARATPPSGVAGGTVLARGTAAETLVIGTPRTTTVTKKVKIRVARKVVTKTVKVQVESVQPLMTCGGSNACETVVQQVTINPGGHTGWHTHPGKTLVTVKSGTFTVYHARDCAPAVYEPGDAFVELPSTVHIGRNETGGTVELGVVFFGVPIGGSPRIDQPQPERCDVT